MGGGGGGGCPAPPPSLILQKCVYFSNDLLIIQAFILNLYPFIYVMLIVWRFELINMHPL